jgi:tocopherol O-methyltransferase
MLSDGSSDFFCKNWLPMVRLFQVDKTYCIHHGLYERGVYGNVQAILNMNDLVGRLLGMNEGDEHLCLLDAGCGFGGITIFLAKRYPGSRFMGITLDPEQVRYAENFAKREGVDGSTEFICGDFCATGFSSDQFDGVFLVESSVYALDKPLLHEMYRILKPGGIIVIIDVFRTNLVFNALLERTCGWFCRCWKLSGVSRLDDFLKIFQAVGFHDVYVRDLTRNIVPSIVRGYLLGIPYIVSMFFRKLVGWKTYNLVDDPRFLAWESMFCLFLGINRAINYTAVTGKK